VIGKARAYAEKHGAEASLKVIPSKFLVEFMDGASLEEDEDFQNIWAKALAGESEKPGSFSLKTLAILKQMTQKEAEVFKRAANYVIVQESNNDYFLPSNAICKYFPLDDVLLLNEAGLISYTSNVFCDLKTKETGIIENFVCSNTNIIASIDMPIYKFVSLEIYTLTRAGREIYSLMENIWCDATYHDEWTDTLKNRA